MVPRKSSQDVSRHAVLGAANLLPSSAKDGRWRRWVRQVTTRLVITKVRDGIERLGSRVCAQGATPEPTCSCEMSGCARAQPLTHHEY